MLLLQRLVDRILEVFHVSYSPHDPAVDKEGWRTLNVDPHRFLHVSSNYGGAGFRAEAGTEVMHFQTEIECIFLQCLFG